MRGRILLPLLLLASVLPSEAWCSNEGKPAPEFTAKFFNGDDFSLKSAANHVVLLHFWATWCDACKTEMPVLDEYAKKHKADGVLVVGISMDASADEPKAREMMHAFSFNSTSGKAAQFKGYGRIWRLPLNFVIDRKGILRKDGWVQDHALTMSDLETTVTPLLKNE